MPQTGGPPDLPGEEGLLGHVRRVPQEGELHSGARSRGREWYAHRAVGVWDKTWSLKAPDCLSTIHLGGCRGLTSGRSRRHRNKIQTNAEDRVSSARPGVCPGVWAAWVEEVMAELPWGSPAGLHGLN